MLYVGHVFKKESHIGKLIYVGRKSSADKISSDTLDLSVLGNSFYMPNESKRNEVCDMYKQYMLEQFLENKQFAQALNTIHDLHETYGDVTLLCWCWPKRCHAGEIVAFINRIIM